MIEKINDRKGMKKFAYFTERHYAGNPYYAPPIYSVNYGELKNAVLKKKTYTALLCKTDGVLSGRLLYTTDFNEHKKRETGYFSYFESINDDVTAGELFGYMEKDLKERGIDYVEGTYSPFDPDNRRGILVKGFDMPPTLFTSYNYPYYEKLLLGLGYTKAYDAYSLKVDMDGDKTELMHALAEQVRRKLGIRVDDLDYGNFDRDLNDVAEIFEAATTEVNYREAPSIETIRRVAKSMKAFINPRFVKIAREPNGRPVGFCLCLPDFNQILMKTHGRIRPLVFLFGKKKITSARGVLQYIIPEYQGRGVITQIFDDIYETFKESGITYFEGGTILEENTRSLKVLTKFGGEIIKTYRIFGKEI